MPGFKFTFVIKFTTTPPNTGTSNKNIKRRIKIIERTIALNLRLNQPLFSIL